ncbi:thioredoxin domain-containing protein 11-like [Anneissia japonica]|uniref:thioredoxin domain-containing protein 11-like n=1 Tax=Anneissia japonica TaxID=1529436 RepID=UPI001425B722|nr:thioredoxin domain-containing protein 11-like [Anneissia japonica]
MVFPASLGLRLSVASLSSWAFWAWKSLSRTIVEMARRPETWCILVTLMFTLFAMKPSGFRNFSSHIPIPQRIFKKGSNVHEFADGNMVVVDEFVKHGEVDFAMVMFYAHWDGTSLNTSQEFENVAKQMSSMDVPFLAVNCWWPYGTCAQYRVLNFYPLITVIHQALGELEYTGLLTAESMMQFLTHIMNPFQYLTDESSVKLFCAEHEVSVIGYFNFMPGLNKDYRDPEGFGSFFKAAVKAVVKDPIQPVHFGVVTNQRLARLLALNHSKEIILRRNLNETLVYPRHFVYKSDVIVSWAYRHRFPAVSWLIPTHRKSLILSNLLKKGASLIIFTPHVEQRHFDNNIHLLRMVTLDYLNCGNSSNIWDTIQTIHSERRLSKYRSADKVRDPVPDTASVECCQTLTNNQRVECLKTHFNTCEVCEYSSNDQLIGRDSCKVNSASIISKSLESFGMHLFSGSNSCLNWLNDYSPFSEIRVCCKTLDKFTDVNKIYSGTDHLQTCDCTNMKSSTKTSKNYHQDFVSENKISDNIKDESGSISNEALKWSEMTGLGCRTNRTLTFYAVRSDLFWSLAEHLGLKETADGVRLAAVIIDYKNEIQHVLPLGPTLSIDSLHKFILNYTNDDLPQFLRSSPEVNNAAHQDISSDIRILEVTADTFHQIVLNNTQDVLLLYYAPWCGYCFRIAPVYLSFANLLRKFGLEGILVSRINADANDLPWEFKVSTYPTIIFFPVGQTNDSVKLPETEQITVLSLVKFTLQHATKSI